MPKSLADISLKQKKLLLVIAATFVLIFGVGFLFNFSSEEVTNAEPLPEKELFDVTKDATDQSYWLYKSEQDLYKANLESMQAKEQAEANKQNLVAQQQKIQDSLLENDLITENKIAELKRRLEILEQANREKVELNPELPEIDNSFPVQDTVIPRLNSIYSDEFELSSTDSNYKPDNYIPSGTYVKAVLLNGLDVSVGMEAQQNPIPILLKLKNMGSLPNGFKSKMKSCRMIATAYGDVSSERAKVRVEKLSCVSHKGKIIETDISGYVVAKDGKEGIRGKMITRDGELLQTGVISGLLSGLGKAVSEGASTTAISPLGATKVISSKDKIKAAAGEGTGNAFELLSKYAIKRMERLQPVIQISAGREVEVVFNQGSEFGAKKSTQAVKKIVKQANTLENIFSPGSLP